MLSPDYSSITFASKSDLVRQWLPVIHLQLDRDWTWDALADISFQITREVTNVLTGAVDTDVAGTIEVRRSISPSARRGGDMTQTDLFFFDAIDPKPLPGEFPSELEVQYTVEPSFKNTPDVDDPLTLAISLPMASPPTQTPKLVSAGVALSPYERADDYSETAPRRRMLWLEFEQPIENVGRNTYFARVLAYAADPMLTDVAPPEPPVPLEPPLPVDPELIRVITPKQSDDRAGLDAMQPLIASTSPRALPRSAAAWCDRALAGALRLLRLRDPRRPLGGLVDGAGALRPAIAGDRRPAPGPAAGLSGRANPHSGFRRGRLRHAGVGRAQPPSDPARHRDLGASIRTSHADRQR